MAERREQPEVILASGSRTRRDILHAAGIAFNVVPADVDEAAIRDGLLAADESTSAPAIAVALAQAKAETVSKERPSALVIGADQVLALGRKLFAKPRDISDARECLMQLRGKTHELHSAVVLAENGQTTWSKVNTAQLTMREFSPAALEEYLQRAGGAICESVGAYQIEGLGIQLFERVEGDHFTILGLPLLPLVAELRARKVLTP